MLQKYKTSILTMLLSGFISAALYHYITPYMFAATLNFFTLLTGFTLRKTHKKLHAALMTSAMLSDITLVLILQYQRNAIATAIAFKLSFLNQAHIFCSTTATVLYFPVLYLGFKLLRGKATPKNRALHLKIGYITLLFRAAGFLLMFSMLHLHDKQIH